jgi:hypothetical protein
VCCPEVPLLSSYDTRPPEEFWEKFPFTPVPEIPESTIDTEALLSLVKKHQNVLLDSQRKRAFSCVNFITNGADAFQRSECPACFLSNTENTIVFGKEVTDTIANWVKKKYAAGPFSEPPFKKFRVNTLMAIKQGDKV